VKDDEIEILESETYYIPSIIRILDEVDNTNLSEEDKTTIVESLVDNNEELTELEKTQIRTNMADVTSLVQKKKKQLLKENILMLVKKTVFLLVLFYVLFFHIFGFTRIPNESMSPNIAAGDLLLYYRLDKDYNAGDVVTFVKDGKRYHLRVLATAGQMISLNTEGEFLVNGDLEAHQTYLKNVIPKKSKIHYPYVVEKGKVFVVGDYRSSTNDSRMFGAIDVKIIDGKVISLLQTKDV
jgi:signal peptidase I